MKLEEYVVGFDNPEVKFAAEWAKKKHEQTYAIRKASKKPYWVHPDGVAKLVIAYGGNFEEIIAALAHDTLEDTDTSFEEIETLFGEEVANIVQEITNDREEVDRLGKEEYINKELESISDSALFVKLADIFYNILDYCTKPQFERMKRNLAYLSHHRKMSGKIKELYDDLASTIIRKDKEFKNS